MTVPDPKYITLAEVRAQTRIGALSDLSDGDLTDLIQTAEDQIDDYVGPQKHHPDDADTDRVFPRWGDVDSNDDPAVPYKVSRAALRQVEWLFTEWWDESSNSLLPMNHIAVERDMRGDGSYAEKRGKIDYAEAAIAPQARPLLMRFRSRTGKISVTDPENVPDAS